jgi:hypothetical protein
MANVRHAYPDESAVRTMRKKIKLSSDGVDPGRKKCRRGHSRDYEAVWRSLPSAGVCSHAVGFIVGTSGRNDW